MNALREKVEQLKGTNKGDIKSTISKNESKKNFTIKVKRGEDYKNLTSNGKCVVNFTAKWYLIIDLLFYSNLLMLNNLGVHLASK